MGKRQVKQQITIIDYSVGNTHSIFNALTFLGYKVSVSNVPKKLASADALIFPGVGAFDFAMKKLKEKKLIEPLTELIKQKKKPILGICLGMQLFATSSEENGIHTGLNWIEAEIKKITLPSHFLVPHVGWNNLKILKKEPIFNNAKDSPSFYFDHSYHMTCKKDYVTSICEYGINIVASIQKENIFGVQFHPEKSQNNGLRLLRNFMNYIDA